MRKLRAIKIDVVNRLISEVTVGDGIEDIKNHIDCDLFTVAANFNPDKNEVMWDSLFVDDEGLLVPDKHLFEFSFPGTNEKGTFAGNGLIIGVDMSNGESTDARISLFDLAGCVEWTNKITTGG